MNSIPTGLQGELIEVSFAEAVLMIFASGALSEQTKTHWVCALRRIAQALDRPMEVIPARYSAVREVLRQLHHAPLGLTAKTLANHKSNVKTALLWLNRDQGVPRHGAPLLPEWESLKRCVADKIERMRLSPLFRYCSAKGITPGQVGEEVIEAYLQYRAASTTRSGNTATRRLLARAWNANVDTVKGWPPQRLVEPQVKSATVLAWEEFPLGLRQDIETYLKGLTIVRKSFSGDRIRPLKPSTIQCRKAELAAAARMAVHVGLPIASLQSLGALLAPPVVRKVLDAYWQKNGNEPKVFSINLAMRFLSIARETGCVDEAGCQELNELRRSMEDHRRPGMTDKNVDLIRQVLTDGVWSKVIRLPWVLMKLARSQMDHAPTQAAVTAQMAVAIAILTVAPIRLTNLTSIRLDFNLTRPGGPESNYWLKSPDYDVKNRVRLDFPLTAELTSLIEEYVHDMRPVLLRGRNEDWLFPGQRFGTKNKISFSGQITGRIQKATGLRITVHQFRHAAGAIILKHQPGAYELVRQLLGHLSIETTKNFYIGLETIYASEIFGQIIRDKLEPDEDNDDD